jgi:hypothetical protein
VICFSLPLARSADSETAQIRRELLDASRALQAGNATSFLARFDRSEFLDYARLSSYVAALTEQSEIASSIDVTEIAPGEDGYQLRVDWLLQLTLTSSPGPIESRQQSVTMQIARRGKKWKITRLEPVDFFRPQYPAQ